MEKEILMPRIGANDDTVVLANWKCRNGEKVERRQVIAILESTKATQELMAPAAGYVIQLVKANTEVKVGDVIARITDNAEDVAEFSSKEPVVEVALKITEKAKQLALSNGIDLSTLPKDKLIREKDIEVLIGPKYTIKESLGNHVIVFGTGGFCREIIHVARQVPAYTVDYVVGGMGDWKDKEQVLGVPVIKKAEMDELKAKGYNKIVNAVAVTSGSTSRKEMFEALSEAGYDFPNIIHNNVTFGENVKMGVGNIVFAGAVIGTEARIGNDCIINVNSTISHGVVLSDHCHVASGAVLAGDVVVGENTLIGQNCSIYMNVHIGKNVIIQNGCSVYKDVPDGTIVKM